MSHTINGLRVEHSVIATSHLEALQDTITRTRQDYSLSNNEAFRRYTDRLNFVLPESFPTAKYIVIFAIEHKMSKINFILDDEKHELILSYPYHKLDASVDEMIDVIQNDIIKDEGFQVEHNRNMFLKILAVRSGLAKYGRNNLCYVDGLGSFLSIYTFFTDFDFKNEALYDLEMMSQCKKCSICINRCPTKAISKESFVIDVDRCIPLYNEIPGEFPEWMKPTVHNSLMGCTICQLNCPINKTHAKKFIQLEDITEEETRMILDGRNDEALAESIGKKLRMFTKDTAYYFLPTIKRNLEALLQSQNIDVK